MKMKERREEKRGKKVWKGGWKGKKGETWEKKGLKLWFRKIGRKMVSNIGRWNEFFDKLYTPGAKTNEMHF